MIVVTVDKDGDVVLRDQGTMIMLHFSLLIDYNWSKNSCTPLHTLGRGKGKSNPTRQGPLPLPPVYPCQYPQGTAYPCQTLPGCSVWGLELSIDWHHRAILWRAGEAGHPLQGRPHQVSRSLPTVIRRGHPPRCSKTPLGGRSQRGRGFVKPSLDWQQAVPRRGDGEEGLS